MHALKEVLQHEDLQANPAARMWGLGGRYYDEVSFAISDVLAHAAQRLAPKPGDKVLDVATGTGWTARNCARFGAEVVGVDFSEGLLDAARELSDHVRPPIRFQLADAENLPFEDATFDGVISTFGVMFAADQKRAAAELARVCKPGGRLALATWPPGGTVEEFFGVAGSYSDAPPPAASPFAWGSPEGVKALLGDDFDLTFEHGVNNAYHEDQQHIWDWYVRGFGPVRVTADSLDADRLAAFRADVDRYHAHFLTESGRLHVRRDYLVTIGTRK
jgi:SAM-dependent methyltransferase